MKLLAYFIDPGDASAAKTRLCGAGIMATVGTADPHVMKPSKSGAERIGLYVVYEDQFDDACLLMKNPDHVPARVISPSEMRRLAATSGKS